MASLCISPLQAGIRLLSTANSSFILDLLRLSIKLCAVFLAIFLPAALVADGCFLLVPAAAAGAEPAVVFVLEVAAAFAPIAGVWDVCSSRGFIWMILRDRVGGGGRLNWSLGEACVADERLRLLTVSLACVGYPAGLAASREEPPAIPAALEVTAGGGSSKANCMDVKLGLSCPFMSVDDAGVGRDVVRGIGGVCDFGVGRDII